MRNESRARRGSSHDDITGPRTIDEVTRWADARPQHEPYFLFLHLWDVHYDFIPPAPYDRMFDGDYTGSISGVDFMENPAVHPQMDARDLQHLLALYDGEIRFTDDSLGKILEVLRARKMLEDTLVVVTADHGEEFFEHGSKGHQKTLFDEVVRIPLIVHWPGELDGGRVVKDQVRIIDVMPSLLAAAGAVSTPPMQGRSILDLARGSQLAPHAALCELHADGQHQRALRTLDFKAYSPGKVRGQTWPDVVFDLAQDPHERAAAVRPHGAALEPKFEELERTSDAALKLRDYLGAQARAIDVDPAMQARLRELGYLDGGEHR
jgi:arylsulfatase A-like enzyme